MGVSYKYAYLNFIKSWKCHFLLASTSTPSPVSIKTSSTESSSKQLARKDSLLKILSLKNSSAKSLKPPNNNSTPSSKTPKKPSKPGPKPHSSVTLCLILARQRYMFDLVHCLRRDQRLLADIMTQEHGKTTPDSMGDVLRGLEVAEHACGTSLVING